MTDSLDTIAEARARNGAARSLKAASAPITETDADRKAGMFAAEASRKLAKHYLQVLKSGGQNIRSTVHIVETLQPHTDMPGDERWVLAPIVATTATIKLHD